MAALKRKDTWSSHVAATLAFKKGLKGWDPRVVERYIKYGLRELPTGLYSGESFVGVTLKTPKHQEALMMLRPDGARASRVETETLPHELVGRSQKLVFRPEPIQVLAQLPYLRPSVLYIFGKLSPMSTDEYRAEKLSSTGVGPGGSGGISAGRVTSRILQEQGHLVPFQAVKICADEVYQWLVHEMERWDWESMENVEWSNLNQVQKMTIAEDHRQKVATEDWSDDMYRSL